MTELQCWVLITFVTGALCFIGETAIDVIYEKNDKTRAPAIGIGCPPLLGFLGLISLALFIGLLIFGVVRSVWRVL